MSTLSQKEKQALNELFVTLSKKQKTCFKMQQIKDFLTLRLKYLFKNKKVKHQIK
ncbi:hypothetical protein [Sulfurospirillum sp. 1612]|uniref:hypothetical protein n=1 Tax=Sulfurospirillum sp. 1612 TaxID=3094835 RepID=UPI002F92ADC3